MGMNIIDAAKALDEGKTITDPNWGNQALKRLFDADGNSVIVKIGTATLVRDMVPLMVDTYVESDLTQSIGAEAVESSTETSTGE